MRQSRDESNGIIFSKLMDKVKNVSDVINYKDLRIKYYNSYSPVKYDKQQIQNNKNKKDLEMLINDLYTKEPLFCQIEIIHVQNEKNEEKGKKYIVEYEKIGYFDLNHSPLKERINIIKKEPINEKLNQDLPPVSADVKVFKAKSDSNGNLIYTKEEGNENNSKYMKNKVGGGIGGIGGAALGVLGGLAYAGEFTLSGKIGLFAAISAGAKAGAYTFAGPVAIGFGAAGAIGVGIGYGIAKLFD